MNTLKKCLPDIAAVIFFILISVAYFFVPMTRGEVLYQGDNTAGAGLNKDVDDHYAKTGDVSHWTNTAFSGMPTYQMRSSYKSTNILNQFVQAYHLWLPQYVWYLFAYLIGFYILLRAFDFRQMLAALGSVIWAFSSYFLIIIAAGHFWKVMALAYLPPMIAGIVLAYKGKYLWGLIVTTIFAAFEINANHVQMTYYYLFVIFFMVLAFLAVAIKNKTLPQFAKATVVCLIAAALGIAINSTNLYHTWQYQKESMRGKSELASKTDPSNQTSSGLDRDYITQWSYGIGETWTLLIPNAKGGASEPMINNKIVQEKGDPQYEQLYQQIGQYWGEQPGTSGPVYVGAFVLFLFILGLFIVKGPMKWALLAATILSILLSWGKNLMGLTNFFIDYMPMYAKFRTVASILVIAEFTIPLLAMMTLKKIVDEPDYLKTHMKFFWISLGCTAGIALIFWLMPGVFFDFISSAENQALAAIPADQLAPIKSNLIGLREDIFRADCIRTIIIILIGVVLTLLYRTKKIDAKVFVGTVIALCLFDMWQVDKRYLNDGMFEPKDQVDQPIAKTPADDEILKDKSLDYRVLNMTTNTFNENNTSYYHNSIGGYHPAKLRRYQELIDHYIMPEMQNMNKVLSPENLSQRADNMMQVTDKSNAMPALNMLNTKYLIVGPQNQQPIAIENKSAMGSAWFVNKVDYVDNANAEIDGIGKIDLHHEAVADKKFEAALGQSAVNDSTAKVTLTAYSPDNLKYDCSSKNGGVIVFSEIYYPEWTATVDGQPAEIGRVNYVLRAINVKPGNHKIVLDFHPKSITTTETISYIASALLLIAILVILFIEFKERKKKAVAEA
ncbi:YfhO family protein [Prevotella lacticifex]|uniref:Membrane protein n=1 Tax=Prevotella lacticifex TaxID=2854755 RepID=A0A9R1CYL7_9BACT|nr:YfhO family protein [Prevotella lacticifex]GJG35963.1 membrane protein [Prevotella lacticifex]GJG38987.1 membrane protein [Prevotella lacticifex]GJG42332.1 membrane protein [Prevotella lacticifex]GJG45342.1 membrane protein [Prevotella lacticifex]GJG48683.1 membrane protein [Prevotella lacticifex]